MTAAPPRVIVIGGGLGGLWASLKIAEAGFPVQLFSLFEVKRSHSVCAQGGINASLDTKGQRDSIWQHIVDTIKGGSYLANQPPIKSLCEEAPGLIRTFERMGVTFSRTPEGLMDLRLFGGVKHKRTCFAGATTGQQLLYACDEQVRAHEDRGLVEKLEWWEFLSIVIDGSGRCCGIKPSAGGSASHARSASTVAWIPMAMVNRTSAQTPAGVWQPACNLMKTTITMAYSTTKTHLA